MLQLNGCAKSQSGSILVGVVVFSLLVSIAACALFTISANGVSRDESAIESDQALRAAQAGLDIGLHWIADTANWRAGYPTRYLILGDNTINGFIVNVSVIDSSAGSRFVISEAQNSRYGFIKELSCRVSIDSMPSVLINDLPPQTTPLGPVRFDGPFHANTPIHLSLSAFTGDSLLFFTNGPVSVRSTLEQGWGYGDAPSGNNYDFGINVVGATASGSDFDKHFDNTFLHSQDSIYLPQISVTPDVIFTNSVSSPGKRSVLFFDTANGVGRARYYWFNSGVGSPASGSPDTVDNIDGKVIRICNDVDVLGIVRGRTTVITDADCSIFPVGDLHYADFIKTDLGDYTSYNNSNNYGVSMGSANFIALISGGDIHFNSGTQMHLPLSNQTTGYLESWPAGGILYVTAALIAANPGKSVLWQSTLWGQIDLNTFQYDIRAIGCRVMDRFFDYTFTAGAEANRRFRFFFDSRLLQGMGAPGVPPFQKRCRGGAGNDLFLLRTVMRERDIPLH